MRKGEVSSFPAWKLGIYQPTVLKELDQKETKEQLGIPSSFKGEESFPKIQMIIISICNPPLRALGTGIKAKILGA
jgi:hypothetical protein